MGNNVVFTAPAPEDLVAAETNYLEIRLTARDALGAQTTVSQDFRPNKVALSFATTPSGLRLEVNGQSFTAPFSFTSWQSWNLALNAPNQLLGPTGYTFLAWSDGGAQGHTFTTPAAPQSVGAAFGAGAPTPEATPFLVVTSTSQANRVEWVNPADPSFVSSVLVFRTNTFPTTPTDGTVVFTGGVAGAKSVFDHLGLTNGVTYYYAAFVNLSGGGVSPGRLARGRPFDTAGPVRWAYSTGATAVAPPGIGSSLVMASNDRVVHAVNRGSAGGSGRGASPRSSWAASRSRGRPCCRRGRCPASRTPRPGAAQDGVVYLIDADTGAPVDQTRFSARPCKVRWRGASRPSGSRSTACSSAPATAPRPMCSTVSTPRPWPPWAHPTPARRGEDSAS